MEMLTVRAFLLLRIFMVIMKLRRLSNMNALVVTKNVLVTG